MSKFLIVLAMAGAMSAPVAAQTQPQQGSSPQFTQPAKPQMIKKRICEQAEEDSYSRLGGRKICRTVEVPVQQGGSASQQTPTTNNAAGK